jgi:hypothetical protein
MAMDDVRGVLAGARAEGLSLMAQVERNVIYAVAFGVLALGSAFIGLAFLGFALYAALLPDQGPVRAACYAAFAAALLVALLLAAMRWLMHSKSAPPEPRPAANPLAGLTNGGQFPPKTLGDLIMLVAAGFAAGLAQKR